MVLLYRIELNFLPLILHLLLPSAHTAAQGALGMALRPDVGDNELASGQETQFFLLRNTNREQGIFCEI